MEKKYILHNFSLTNLQTYSKSQVLKNIGLFEALISMYFYALNSPFF